MLSVARAAIVRTGHFAMNTGGHVTRPMPEASTRVAAAGSSRMQRASFSLAACLAAALGIGLTLLVVRGFAQLGESPLNQVLALHSPDLERDSATAVAAESGSQLLRFGVLAGGAAAAALLLLGGWHSIVPRRSVQQGRRLLVTGLWLALAVSVLAALPLGAPVLVAELTVSVPWMSAPAAAWQPAVPELLAVGAGAGLLLAAASSGPGQQAIAS